MYRIRLLLGAALCAAFAIAGVLILGCAGGPGASVPDGPATLEVRVVSASDPDQGIPGLSVSVKDSSADAAARQSPGDALAGVTDSDGTCILQGLAEGANRLQLSPPAELGTPDLEMGVNLLEGLNEFQFSVATQEQLRALSALSITPTQAALAPGGTQQFEAELTDATGQLLPLQPTWTVLGTGGTITPQGLFTAGPSAGADLVCCQLGMHVQFASVVIAPEGVEVPTNEPPVISTVEASPGMTVGAGARVTLTPVASDADGDDLRAEWLAMGGSIEPGDMQATWIAPSELGSCTVSVVVFDGKGGFDVAAIDLVVAGENVELSYSHPMGQTSDGALFGPSGIDVGERNERYVLDVRAYRIQVFSGAGAPLRKWGCIGDREEEFQAGGGIAASDDGFVYITDARRHRVMKWDSNGSLLASWGGEGTQPGRFSTPLGIAVDASGYVYVTDRSDRIQKFTPDGEYLRAWGRGLMQPMGLAVAPDGTLYVADTWNHQVKVYGPSSQSPDQTWGVRGGGAGQGDFNEPHGIALDADGLVYVVESGNHRVQVFTSDGEFVRSWGGHGTNHGQFDYPTGITVDSAGRVHVCDRRNGRVEVFSSDGQWLAQTGYVPDGEGQFSWPEGITVSSDGGVHVADSGNGRIQVLSADGSYVSQWSHHEGLEPKGLAAGADGILFIADEDRDRILKRGAEGNIVASWSPIPDHTVLDTLYPADTTVDPEGMVYLNHAYGSVLSKLTPDDLQPVSGWSPGGSGGESIGAPAGLDCDSAGNVYLAESGRHRLRKLSSSGEVLATWGSSGSGPGQVDWPRDVAVDGQGAIYIADTKNHRIQVWRPDGSYITEYDCQREGLNRPQYLALSPDETLLYVTFWVGDVAAYRITRR